jgi:hypothetical protein
MWFVTCLFALSLGTPAGNAAETTAPEHSKPPPAKFSARELKDVIRSICQRIRSLRVRYKSEGYDPKQVRAGTFVHCTVIAKAPCLLFHDSAHGYPGLPWEADLFRQTAYITATHERNVYPANRAYFLRELAPNAFPAAYPRNRSS